MSPSSARGSLVETAPISRATPAMRSSPPRDPATVAPSAKAPRSTRASDNLPPCAVWIVRTICASGGPCVGDAEPLAGLRDAGRLVAQRLQQPRHAVAGGRRPDQQRHDMALAQFLREVVEHPVARRLDVADEFLHQRVVVVGEPLEHANSAPAFRRSPTPAGIATTCEGADSR